MKIYGPVLFVVTSVLMAHLEHMKSVKYVDGRMMVFNQSTLG